MDNAPGRLDICIIVAMTPARVIGNNGTLPWKLKSDLRRLRERTLGHSVVMGYRTFLEIIHMRGRPLDGRTNFVVTQTHVDEVRALGAIPVPSVLTPLVEVWAAAQELFVLGGARVYEEVLPYADRLLITMVDAHVEGDTHFPLYNIAEWQLVGSAEPTSSLQHPEDEFPSRFLEYERIRD